MGLSDWLHARPVSPVLCACGVACTSSLVWTQTVRLLRHPRGYTSTWPVETFDSISPGKPTRLKQEDSELTIKATYFKTFSVVSCFVVGFAFLFCFCPFEDYWLWALHLKYFACVMVFISYNVCMYTCGFCPWLCGASCNMSHMFQCSSLDATQYRNQLYYDCCVVGKSEL